MTAIGAAIATAATASDIAAAAAAAAFAYLHRAYAYNTASCCNRFSKYRAYFLAVYIFHPNHNRMQPSFIFINILAMRSNAVRAIRNKTDNLYIFICIT